MNERVGDDGGYPIVEPTYLPSRRIPEASSQTRPAAEPQGGPSEEEEEAQLPKTAVSAQGAIRLPPMRLVDPASAHAGYYVEDDY